MLINSASEFNYFTDLEPREGHVFCFVALNDMTFQNQTDSTIDHVLV